MVLSRTFRVLVLAVLFGAAISYLKGIGPGLRSDVGNLSAPWLVLPFLASLGATSLSRGSAMGLITSTLALAGFYAVQTLMLQDHLGNGGFLRELPFEMSANRIYLLAGVATGPVLGVFGAWFGGAHRQWTWAVVGGLLVGEICVVALVQGHQLLPAPLYFRWGVDHWTAYWLELAGGLAVIIGAWFRRHRLTGDVRRGVDR